MIRVGAENGRATIAAKRAVDYCAGVSGAVAVGFEMFLAVGDGELLCAGDILVSRSVLIR